MQNMSITRQVLTLPAAYAKNSFNFVLLPQKKKMVGRIFGFRYCGSPFEISQPMVWRI